MVHERTIQERDSTDTLDSLERGSDPSRASRAGGAPVAVTVNGSPQEIAAGATVADLVRRLGMDGRRIAVAVNHTVVPRSRLDRYRLAEGDRVEILEAVGGG